MTQTARYGSWKSPITTGLIAASSLRLGEVHFDGDDLYWAEGRAAEKGRTAIVRRRVDGRIEDVLAEPFNARSQVHEYGGGAFTVHQGTLYFVNFLDQRIYVQPPGGEPAPLTAEGALRYGDLLLDGARNRLICIVEDHSRSDQEAENSLAAVSLEDGAVTILEEGNDFYGYAALSPDGGKIAWLTWQHPNMPWDGTELWVADLDGQGRLSRRQQAAGGDTESIFQPQWSPEGTLYFVSDRSEWWNLYRWVDEESEPVLAMEAEFGLPQWVFGMSTYGFLTEQTLLAAYTQEGIWHLGMVDTENQKLRSVQTPYTDISGVQVHEQSLACLAGSPHAMSAVCLYDLLADEWETVRQSSEAEIDPAYFSEAQAVEFPTANHLTAHGFYYPPANPEFNAPEDETPPLIVISHGGPTSFRSNLLSLGVQYWTSRGFAVLDVNYGGSTGYGRSYRLRLNGNWGIVDVQDCENGAKYLAKQGLADPERLIIRGGSAGGYTTLCALAFGSTFSAGASYYGIGDLEVLAKDTHKFESRYLDSMVGPYPETKELYEARSPLKHYRQIESPVIFFQGLDDRVVPPEQSETMFEAVRAKEIPTAYLAFEGEGHGFRQAETIERTLQAELYFYSKVFDFELADAVEPIEIENQ